MFQRLVAVEEERTNCSRRLVLRAAVSGELWKGTMRRVAKFTNRHHNVYQ